MVTQYCLLEWEHIEYQYLHQDNSHAYTTIDQLPHRCLEGVYIVALLRDAFGFQHDQRQITFALEVRSECIVSIPVVLLLMDLQINEQSHLLY